MDCHNCTLQEFVAMSKAEKKVVLKVCRKHDRREACDLRAGEGKFVIWFRKHSGDAAAAPQVVQRPQPPPPQLHSNVPNSGQRVDNKQVNRSLVANQFGAGRLDRCLNGSNENTFDEPNEEDLVNMIDNSDLEEDESEVSHSRQAAPQRKQKAAPPTRDSVSAAAQRAVDAIDEGRFAHLDAEVLDVEESDEDAPRARNQSSRKRKRSKSSSRPGSKKPERRRPSKKVKPKASAAKKQEEGAAPNHNHVIRAQTLPAEVLARITPPSPQENSPGVVQRARGLPQAVLDALVPPPHHA